MIRPPRIQSFLHIFVGLCFFGVGSSFAQPFSSGAPVTLRGVEGGVILKRLGAKMEKDLSDAQIRQYQGHFNRMDQNGDGAHSKVEFIGNGSYLNPQSRRGIFNAADRDRNGVVTRAEYILNRIITDEGKAIVQAMDDDRDGVVERAEFLKHATVSLSDADLAMAVFDAFDSNGDDEIVVPEYLRVWGQWARSDGQTAAQRLPSISGKDDDLNVRPSSPIQEERLGQQPEFRGPPGGFSVERLFRFDLNGDDQVSEAELPAFLRERILGRIDANKDGIIDRKEAEAIGSQNP
jgi:Ca2+-binding EF-hand superfamily protein